MGLQYGEEDGAEEVISRGGNLRVQSRDLSHFTEWRSEPLVDWETEVREVQRIPQRDRLRVTLPRSETKGS